MEENGIWILVVAVIVAATVLKKHPELLKKMSGGSDKIGLTSPGVRIATVIFVFNLVIMAMIPWLWDILTYTWYTLLLFNLGFWTVFYLRTIKVKDAAGKETKEDDPVAMKLASILAMILAAGLITTSWLYFKTGDLTHKEYTDKQEAEKTIRRLLIKEPALAVIAQCNPKEFDTPKKMEDAIKLYGEKGLLPWTKSSDCWGLKMTEEEYTLAIITVNKEFGEMITTPTTKGYKIFWDSPQKYEVMVNEFPEFFVWKGEEVQGTINSTRFKGIGGPAKIRVWLSKH